MLMILYTHELYLGAVSEDIHMFLLNSSSQTVFHSVLQLDALLTYLDRTFPGLLARWP